MKSGCFGVVVGLMLVALLAGCGKPAQAESIAAIEKLGGKFSDDGKKLDLRNTKVTDAGLAHLEGLTGLQMLDLEGTKVTDAWLAHLKGMAGLQMLDLEGTKVTDAGLAHLKGMTGMRTLDLRWSKVTNAGVEKLQAALPKCTIYH